MHSAFVVFLFIISSLLIVVVSSKEITDLPVVKIKQGKLQGKINTAHQGTLYYSFQGIPYGKAPVKNLRFKAPKPADSWDGTRNAFQEGNSCYTVETYLRYVHGNEDCLYLNVYTPNLPSKSSKVYPVMFWIHGGGFKIGSGASYAYSPDYLIPHDVVVVTINYRLGLFGFLSFDDASLNIPGNAGLKDQVLALKWVRDNIAAFSGDPKNVIIFGESAGAASVHYLTLSPMTKGLFSKAIMQSGTALSRWAISQKLAKPIANALNHTSTNEKLIFETLTKMTSQEILNLSYKLPRIFLNHTQTLVPIIEPYSSEETFIIEHPEDILIAGKNARVPIIIGYCSREGMMPDLNSKVRLKMDVAEYVVPVKFLLPEYNETAKQIAKKIKNFYLNGKDVPKPGSMENYLLQGDSFFLNYIFTTLGYLVKDSETPVFLYRFSIETQLNIWKKINNIKLPGVTHGDDVPYIFQSSFNPSLRPGSLEEQSVHRITTLWTSFAHSGNPNPKNSDPLIGVTWKPIEKDILHYIDIGETLTVGTNPEHERMQLWEEILKIDPNGL